MSVCCSTPIHKFHRKQDDIEHLLACMKPKHEKQSWTRRRFVWISDHFRSDLTWTFFLSQNKEKTKNKNQRDGSIFKYDRTLSSYFSLIGFTQCSLFRFILLNTFAFLDFFIILYCHIPCYFFLPFINWRGVLSEEEVHSHFAEYHPENFLRLCGEFYYAIVLATTNKQNSTKEIRNENSRLENYWNFTCFQYFEIHLRMWSYFYESFDDLVIHGKVSWRQM